MDLVIARLRDECQERECQQNSSGKEEWVMKSEVKTSVEKKEDFFYNKSGHFRSNCRKFLASKIEAASSTSQKTKLEQQTKHVHAKAP